MWTVSCLELFLSGYCFHVEIQRYKYISNWQGTDLDCYSWFSILELSWVVYVALDLETRIEWARETMLDSCNSRIRGDREEVSITDVKSGYCFLNDKIPGSKDSLSHTWRCSWTWSCVGITQVVLGSNAWGCDAEQLRLGTTEQAYGEAICQE